MENHGYRLISPVTYFEIVGGGTLKFDPGVANPLDWTCQASIK